MTMVPKSFEQCLSILKEKTRLTAHRQIVLQILKENSGDHFTADQVHRKVIQTFPSVSLATVYNVLSLLKTNELIGSYGISKNGSILYEGDETPHSHLVCTECNKIQNIDVAFPIEAQLEEMVSKLDFDVKLTRTEILGKCFECTAAGEKLIS